jgi:hypothetical protein
VVSALLNEQGWHPDLIELQLAHAERNKVRAAYNRALRLDERRKMMQAWGDYLDALAACFHGMGTPMLAPDMPAEGLGTELCDSGEIAALTR